MKLQSMFSALFFLLATTVVWGQIHHTISYQGLLIDANGKPVLDGNYNLTIKLYSMADGGAPLWTETQTIAIKNGAFDAVLGSTKRLDIPLDKPYWISHTVGTGPELTPRIEFAASASNVNAESDGLALVSGNMLTHSSAGTRRTNPSQKLASNNGFALSGCLIINCSRQSVGGPMVFQGPSRQN